MRSFSKISAIENMAEKTFRPMLTYADEAHHSAANSYKKVMDYFTSKLWLGMTATPDKRDDNMEGRNIYEIFNHQVAYEIRLQDAMKEDLLCPFHYFAITDLEVIADSGKSMEEKIENFRYLTSDERVGNVMKQAEFFGYDGDRVKGLIFCSRIDEAKELSRKFNEKGWRTLVISGGNSESTRAAAIERLAGDDSENALDYILSVEIFSEGWEFPGGKIEPGIPESFKVLLKELQSLALDVRVLRDDQTEVELGETVDYGDDDFNSIMQGDGGFRFDTEESLGDYVHKQQTVNSDGEFVDVEDEGSADDDTEEFYGEDSDNE